MSFFALAPSLGPTLGPFIGGFLGENKGWRWVMGLIAIFSGVLWVTQSVLVPETYGPVLLRKRAAALSKITGKVYSTKVDIQKGQISLKHIVLTTLTRPWILLIMEPIVLLLSLYLAIVYGEAHASIVP
jgi:MFS family permease